MVLVRHTFRSTRPSVAFGRCLSSASRRFAGPGNAKEHLTAEEHRKIQRERPLNPDIPGSYSTIKNKMPLVGAHEPPPDLLTSVDPDFKTDSSTYEGEIGVGELQGAKFKIEPLRRTGENLNTMRARLLCPYSIRFSLPLKTTLTISGQIRVAREVPWRVIS